MLNKARPDFDPSPIAHFDVVTPEVLKNYVQEAPRNLPCRRCLLLEEQSAHDYPHQDMALIDESREKFALD
jgi:hypothetical protein